MPPPGLFVRRAIIVLAGLVPATASAQPVTWTGSTSGSWSVAGNWSPNGVPASSDNTQLTFGATPNPAMVNDIGTLVLNSMSFNAGSPAYSLSGNGLNFQTNGSGGLPQIVSNSSNAVSIGTLLTLTNNLTVGGTGNVSLSSGVGGPGSLTMAGTGTLTLSGDNSFAGGLNVTNGTVAIATYVSLGAGNVTGGPLGTLIFTGPATTFKSFAMNGGTVAVAAGQTVNFSGGTVTATYLDGAGTFGTGSSGAQFIDASSTPSVAIISNSAADEFRNFTNSANFTVASGVNSSGSSTNVTLSGFTNQGLGAVTIGANSKVNVSNFQSYGTLTLISPTGGGQSTVLKNVGTAPLSFNTASRTTIGTLFNGSAVMDLNGVDGIVTGGRFVNNGSVIDSSNNGMGTGRMVAHYGSSVGGGGFFQNPVQTFPGARFETGIGASSFGSLVLGPGGVSNYVFAIDDATGTPGGMAGPSGQAGGWGLMTAIQRPIGTAITSGNFSWTATPASGLTVALSTIVGPTTSDADVGAPMANFDPSQPYVWPAVQWVGNYSGPTDPAALDAATSFDTSGFLNPIAGDFGWQLDVAGHSLSLTYAPSAVPEPGTLALTILAGLGWMARWLRRPNPPYPLDPFVQFASHIPQNRFR
jgi:autotransporter-associated beta strand protein